MTGRRNEACSDYNLGRVCATKLRIAERNMRWPHDFDAKGLPLETRGGRGTPAYVQNMNGDTCYAVAYGSTQLHGQDGTDKKYSAQAKYWARALSTTKRAGHVVIRNQSVVDWRLEWQAEVQQSVLPGYSSLRDLIKRAKRQWGMMG